MKDAISQVYESKEKLIIIGLTGRTGSGCSKVAEILETSKFEDLHMKSAKSYDYKSSDERKFSIIYCRHTPLGFHNKPQDVREQAH